MVKEGSQDQEGGDIFEAEAEKKLKELARAYWLKYHLSRRGKDFGAEGETAQEAYTRYLEKLENFGMLPSQKITEIIREVQDEAEQDAVALIEEEEKARISGLS